MQSIYRELMFPNGENNKIIRTNKIFVNIIYLHLVTNESCFIIVFVPQKMEHFAVNFQQNCER